MGRGIEWLADGRGAGQRIRGAKAKNGMERRLPRARHITIEVWKTAAPAHFFPACSRCIRASVSRAVLYSSVRPSLAIIAAKRGSSRQRSHIECQ